MRESVPQQAVTCQAQSVFAPWLQRSVLPEANQRSGLGTIVGAAQEHYSDPSEPLRLSCNFAQLPIFSKPQTAFQTKLAIGQPNDVYEQEADQIAGRVMRMPEPQLPGNDTRSGLALNSQGGQQRSKLDRIQTKPDGANSASPLRAPSIVAEVLNSSGQPLDAQTRAYMEPRFGHDFSRVKIHSDARAAESARAVNALAFTVKDNIVFGAGMFQPATEHGKKLLAHELAHTIQPHANGLPMVQRSTHRGQEDYFDPENCWTEGSTKDATNQVIGRFIGIIEVPNTCDGAIKMTVRFEVIGGWSLLGWLGGSAAPLLFTPATKGIDAATLIPGNRMADDAAFQYDVSYPLDKGSCGINFDLYLVVTYRRGGHHPKFAEVKFSPATRLAKDPEGLIDESMDPVVRVDSCGRLQPTLVDVPSRP